MFNHISILGWVIIIGLAAFILVLNLGLLLGVKQKMQKDNWIDKMTEAGKVMRHPLKKEFDQLQTLSDQVAKFKQEANQKNNEKEE